MSLALFRGRERGDRVLLRAGRRQLFSFAGASAYCVPCACSPYSPRLLHRPPSSNILSLPMHNALTITRETDESDLIDAFVACGGNADMSGSVETKKLTKIIKDDFGLTIDIERMIDMIDKDKSGKIEYDEFKALLTLDHS